MKEFPNSWSLQCGVSGGSEQVADQRHILKELTLSLNRSEKDAVINDVTELAAKAQTLVMAEYRGIKVDRKSVV